MSYTITNPCIGCDCCYTLCPTGAIKKLTAYYSSTLLFVMTQSRRSKSILATLVEVLRQRLRT